MNYHYGNNSIYYYNQNYMNNNMNSSQSNYHFNNNIYNQNLNANPQTSIGQINLNNKINYYNNSNQINTNIQNIQNNNLGNYGIRNSFNNNVQFFDNNRSINSSINYSNNGGYSNTNNNYNVNNNMNLNRNSLIVNSYNNVNNNQNNNNQNKNYNNYYRYNYNYQNNNNYRNQNNNLNNNVYNNSQNSINISQNNYSNNNLINYNNNYYNNQINNFNNNVFNNSQNSINISQNIYNNNLYNNQNNNFNKNIFNNSQNNINISQNIYNNNNLNNYNNNLYNIQNNNLNKNIFISYNNDINNNNQIKPIPEENTQKNYEIKLDFMIRARGLANVGATCYMNATLQCFYHVKALSENLINDKEINSGMEITYCYKKLIEELTGCTDKTKFMIDAKNFTTNQKIKDYIEPNEFKEIIGDKNPLFKGIKACDSKDLILFLLENMDNELTIRNNRGAPKKVFYGNNVSQMDKDFFKKCHNSIVADLFYGFKSTRMVCQSCRHTDENYSVFNFLIFPLEKYYNSLNQNNNVNNYNNYNNGIQLFNNYNGYNYNGFKFYGNNSMQFNLNGINSPTSFGLTNRFNLNNNIQRKLNLYQCFSEYQKAEILTGQNKIYCNKCKQNSNAFTQDEIYKAPNVLILIINRGKGNTFKCDLDFPTTLDISSYVKNKNISPKIYNLIGVISHLGDSSMDGHFIAMCKHFDGNWYLFNDSIVAQISDNEITRKGIPYILFYQNKDLKV